MQIVQAIEEVTSAIAGDTVWVAEKEDGVFAGTEPDPLMAGGEEAAAPETSINRLATLILADENDVGRQVVVFGAEPVAEPGSERGATGELGSGLEEGDGGVVVYRLGMNRFHETEVIRDFSGVREKLADRCG